MRLLKLTIISLLLMACDEPKTNNGEKLSPTAQNVGYVKDERTGLCFVDNVVHDGYYGLGFTHVYSNVPCSPEVERLLVK